MREREIIEIDDYSILPCNELLRIFIQQSVVFSQSEIFKKSKQTSNTTKKKTSPSTPFFWMTKPSGLKTQHRCVCRSPRSIHRSQEIAESLRSQAENLGDPKALGAGRWDPVVFCHGKSCVSWVSLGTLVWILWEILCGCSSPEPSAKPRQDTPKDWHKNDAAQMHSQ